MGTENLHLHQCSNHDIHFGEKSFYMHPQSIEWLSRILKKEVGQLRMDLFAEIASCAGETVSRGTFLDTNILQFCLLTLFR